MVDLFPPNITNFAIIDKLAGRGGMSDVYICENDNFVAKKLHLYTVFPWLELYIMQSEHLEHENLTRGKVRVKDDGIYIYQKKAQGDLKLFENVALDYEDITEIMYQIVSGLLFLHEKGFIHCDLKPSNVLVFSQEPLHVKISDFGLSTKYNWYHQEQIGSERYRAPETEKEGWDEKVDIWGLGQILFFLLTKEHYTGSWRQDEEKASFWYQMCRWMLQPDPKDRMSVEDLAVEMGLPFRPPAPCTNESKLNEAVHRVFKEMKAKGSAKGVYMHIAKEMVLRHEMPSSYPKCLQEIKAMNAIVNSIEI